MGFKGGEDIVISIYLNQLIKLKSLASIDEYGQANYIIKKIPARYEYSRKIVKDKLGSEVISEARCFTSIPVKPDDVITFDSRDWTVISATSQVGLSGIIEHYEVRV